MNIYIELIKPRILSLSMMTLTLGYGVARVGDVFNFSLFFWTFFGVALCSAGAAALNQGLEHKFDALMERTKLRPVPSGRISLGKVYVFGCGLILSGSVLLGVFVNYLTLILCLGTAILYVLVYTPLKRVSWVNTYVGTIPGAMPVLCGWAAAKGVLSELVWPFFLVIAIWQLPHFFSIAWMYRDSYKGAGFNMLTNSDDTGRLTSFHILSYAILLAAVSFLPFLTGLLGMFYFVSMVILNVFFLVFCLKFLLAPSMTRARHVLRSSIVYPMLFIIFVFIDLAG
jgi:heme o synthase